MTGSLFSQTDVLPPVLVSPTDGDDDQVLDVTMNWYAVSGIGMISYELQYDTDDSFGDPVSITTQYTSGNGENLLFGTTYFWRVRSMDDSGTSEWSDVYSYITFAQMELKEPGDEDDGLDASTEIEWKVKYGGTSLSGLTHYDYDVAYDTNFTEMFKSGSIAYEETTAASVSTMITLLRFDTVYYWRVRARHDVDESLWSETWSFRTIDACANEFPEDGAVNQMLDVTIQWEEMPGTFEYIYELCDDPNFSSPCIFFTDENSVSAMGLTFGKSYYWRVKGAHTTDTSNWSETWSFETLNSVTRLTPESGSYVDDIFPTFEWEEVTGVTGFVVLYDDNENFSDPVADTVDGDKTTHKVLFALEMDQTYYWKMKIFEGGDTTDYNEDAWSFIVGIDGINDLLSAHNVSIYPNPATSDLNIEVNSTKNSVVEVDLLNLLGQTVLMEQFRMNQGMNTSTMNISNLENGLYIVRLKSGGDTFMKKIVIEK